MFESLWASILVAILVTMVLTRALRWVVYSDEQSTQYRVLRVIMYILTGEKI